MSGSSETGIPRGNGVGRAALVVAIVMTVVQVAQTAVAQAAPAIQANFDLSSTSISLIFVPFEVVVGLLGATALALGIVGLTRRDRPKGAAGAGAGLGAGAVLLLLTSLAISLIYRVAL